ncbi:hypothetical protein ACLB2K_072045 [Fragaria x ananassa]
MRNRAEYVSIDLRNLDGVILEDESDKENGGDGSRNATGPAVEDILQIHDKAMNRWNTIYHCLCICGGDVFYLIDIIIFLGGICKKRKGKLYGVFWKSSSEKKRALPLKKMFRKRCSLQLSILPRILVSLPIPAVVMVLSYATLSSTVRFDPLYESQARSNQHKLKEKKQLMKPDIDLWLSKNDLSNLKRVTKGSMDLKSTIKKKTLKTVITENIDKLDENRDIDLQNIISVLPIKFKKNITRLLCLASLTKSFTLYTEDSYIVQEGKPLGMMLFITQGLAWSYTTEHINGGRTSFDSSSNEWLKKGDFYGEVLLNWAFKSPSFSALPISTRTVMSQEKVEAFTLRASDLKSIVCKFWWHFTRELEQVELEQWENAAASSIQGAWRNRLAKARRSNRWDKFTAHY